VDLLFLFLLFTEYSMLCCVFGVRLLFFVFFCLQFYMLCCIFAVQLLFLFSSVYSSICFAVYLLYTDVADISRHRACHYYYYHR